MTTTLLNSAGRASFTPRAGAREITHVRQKAVTLGLTLVESQA